MTLKLEENRMNKNFDLKDKELSHKIKMEEQEFELKKSKEQHYFKTT